MSIAFVGFAAELAARVERVGPVTVGLAGAGQMGTDIVVQLLLMPGIRLGVLSVNNPRAARDVLVNAGHDSEAIAEVGSARAADAAIERGRVALVTDVELLCSTGLVDVVIDATGNPNVGATIALEAFRNGKHVVMLNVEADITIGRYLAGEARRAGLVYTGAAGDEPAATLELIGFAQSVGFEIVAAGKGKNNPLKLDATPDAYEAEARARNMNARVLVEFVDGSKTNIEMVAVANATGLVPDVPGMHGPAAMRDELAQVLCTKEDGGILARSGVVDYTIGKDVAPGVFCIVKPLHPRVIERMCDIRVGPGPCYTLFRPYHLTSLEAPLSALRAVLRGTPDMVPIERPVAECVAVAKRDLAAGDLLGKIGEYDYRGVAVTCEEAIATSAIPLGLAERTRVLRPIRAGEQLTYINCAPDESLLVTQIRRRLDEHNATCSGRELTGRSVAAAS